MRHICKFVGVSLVILSFLPIAACTEGAMVLMVTVDTPQDGATVSASPVTVSGTVNKTAEVKVNDVVVPVKGGKFSTDVKLTEGNNVINVVATKGTDSAKQTVNVIYKPSK